MNNTLEQTELKKETFVRVRETEKAIQVNCIFYYGTNSFHKIAKVWVPKSCLEFVEEKNIHGVRLVEEIKEWFWEKKYDELVDIYGEPSWFEFDRNVNEE